MKKRKKNRRQVLWLLLCAGMLVLAAALLGRLWTLSRSLPSQQAARRWQGDSSQSFAQVSCFVPVDEPVTQQDIYSFRYKVLDELHKAALDAEGADGLWLDAWCGMGKLTVSSSRASGEASVIAVGGEFFAFHPLRLLSGSYLSESDLMKDRVLLDEDLAWLLFGGTDLQGMSIRINDVPFVVGGVIEREQDEASRLAYTAGQGLYMSYEAYVGLVGAENENISCYELVLAEPVQGFAARVAGENFKLGRGEVLQNTGRYTLPRLLKLAGRMSQRSMQAMGLMYPYWENAARVVEDRCARLLLAALALCLAPACTALAYGWRALLRGKEKLEDELLPKLKDGAEETIRRQQRRRWERKHGVHEKL